MKFEVYRGLNGDWRWRLKTTNGRIIADSAEGYRKRASCLRGLRRVQQSHTAQVIFVE